MRLLVLVWSLVGERMMITDTSAEAVAKLVYEREALSLAICGGEPDWPKPGRFI
jgi:hypothetical protein